MSPKDKNILDTLNLLTLLFRTRKDHLPKLSEDEQHTLTVTKEHLQSAGVTVPVFVNTLKTLHSKGYLVATSIYEDKYHEKIRDTFKDENYNKMLENLSENGLDKLSDEHKIAIADGIQSMAPPDFKVDKEELLNTEVTFKEIFDDTKRALGDHMDDDVSVVILMPFRDIDVLLEKMNNGQSFGDIQDSGIWYDPIKYEFHVGDDIIPVSYQSKPNAEHDVLVRFADGSRNETVWYDEIDSHKPRTLKDALLRFVGKHRKLKQIFTVYSDRLEIDVEALK